MRGFIERRFVNVAVGLLEAWPLAILVDRVLTSEPKGDWIHDAFLALLPGDKLDPIVGLVQALGLTYQSTLSQGDSIYAGRSSWRMY